MGKQCQLPWAQKEGSQVETLIHRILNEANLILGKVECRQTNLETLIVEHQQNTFPLYSRPKVLAQVDIIAVQAHIMQNTTEPASLAVQKLANI